MRKNGFYLMKRLWKMVRPVRGKMYLCMTGGVIGNLSILVTLTSGAAFMCSFIGENIWFSRSTWLVIMLISAALRGPCRYLEQYKGHDVAYTLLAYMRVDIYNKLCDLAPARLTDKRNGDVLSVAIGDVECVEAFFAHTIAPILIAVVTVICSVAFCSIMWAPLGLIVLPLYLLVGIVIPVVSAKVGREKGRRYRTGLGEMKSFLLDSLRGIKEIISFGQGKDRTEKLDSMEEK